MASRARQLRWIVVFNRRLDLFDGVPVPQNREVRASSEGAVSSAAMTSIDNPAGS